MDRDIYKCVTKSGERHPCSFFSSLFNFSSLFFVATAILPNTKPPRLRPCTMAWFIETTLTTMNLLLRLFHRPRARKAKNQAQEKKPASTDSVVFSSDRPPPCPTPSSNDIQHEHQDYYYLAQRLQQLSPPACNWLGPDVQITDMTHISSGGISEIWKGSLKDRVVAVKSLRCYSSPEFEPAEVGIVSLHRYARLG